MQAVVKAERLQAKVPEAARSGASLASKAEQSVGHLRAASAKPERKPAWHIACMVAGVIVPIRNIHCLHNNID